MPLAKIDTLSSTPADDRPALIAPECLLDLLFGAALIAQGHTTDQAAAYLRRSQAQRRADAACHALAADFYDGFGAPRLAAQARAAVAELGQ